MAMTGGTAYLVKSEYTNSGQNNWTTDLYIYVKIVSQNPAANTSTIALGMYVYSKYNIDWGDWSNGGQSYVGTATSGANCFTFTEGQTGSGTKWLTENHQVTVTHNADGTLTLPIYWHWGVYSTWGQYLAPSGSKNVTLTAIDRTAPTVTFSVSSITANGFTINASSSATADLWQYSTNNGSSWTQLSTTEGTSASKVVTGLSPNTTYTVKVRARKKTNGVSVSNTTGDPLTVGVVSKSGTVAVVLTVTDSRGWTASVTQNITVVAYAKPKVNSLTLRRTNDIEAEMQLVFNGTISAITVDGTQKNSLLYCRYRYKATSATSYSSYVSILSAVTQSGTSFSYSNLELRNLASDQSWDVHIQIRDQLNSLSSLDLYYVIPQGTPLVALRKMKVGINTPTPEAALHVVGDAKVSGTLTATTLSGALAPSKLSSAVPISKGGTGATTAAAARTNLAVLPLAGGTITGQVQKAGAGSSFINGRSIAMIRVNSYTNTSSFYPAVSMKTPSASWEIGAYGESLYFVYATDANFEAGTNTTLTRYINSSGNFNGKAANVTGTVALANGGTGATTAAAARTNLGIACTSLYNGELTTGSITFNYGNYNAYIILGKPGTATAIAGIVVPKAMITTTDVKYQITDESYYRCFNLKYSSTTVTLTISTGGGSILRVFGIN